MTMTSHKRVGRPGKYDHIIKALISKVPYSASMVATYASVKSLAPFDLVLGKDARAAALGKVRRAMVKRAEYYRFPKHGDQLVDVPGQPPVPGWFGHHWKATLKQTPTKLNERARLLLAQFDPDSDGTQLLMDAEEGLIKLMEMATTIGAADVVKPCIEVLTREIPKDQDAVQKLVCESVFAISVFWEERLLAKKLAKRTKDALTQAAAELGLVGRDALLLLRSLPNQTFEYWRQFIVWDALKAYAAMVSPGQVLGDIRAERSIRDLTRWLHFKAEHLSYVDRVLSSGAHSSGLALLRAAQLCHIKLIYAEVLSQLEDAVENEMHNSGDN
jgi:hypothetical protein